MVLAVPRLRERGHDRNLVVLGSFATGYKDLKPTYRKFPTHPTSTPKTPPHPAGSPHRRTRSHTRPASPPRSPATAPETQTTRPPNRGLLVDTRGMEPQWHDGDPAQLLLRYLDSPLESLRTPPLQCPSCQAMACHVFFLRHTSNGFGGGWVWCSSCRLFVHARVKVPTWWVNSDAVDPDDLAAIPEALENVVSAVDHHWGSLP
jgi:hypothetical protein